MSTMNNDPQHYDIYKENATMAVENSNDEVENSKRKVKMNSNKNWKSLCYNKTEDYGGKKPLLSTEEFRKNLKEIREGDFGMEYRGLPPDEFMECPQIFNTFEVYKHFMTNGAWQSFPGANLIRVDLRNIDEIDCLNGRFSVSAFITQCFNEVPGKVQVRNALDGDDILRIKENFSERSGYPSIITEINEKKFCHNFDLSEFPFDVQDLPLYFSMSNEPNLEVLKNMPESFKNWNAMPREVKKKWSRDQFWIPVPGYVNMRTKSSNWNICAPTLEVFLDHSDEMGTTISERAEDFSADDSLKGSSNLKPTFKFTIKTVRKWEWYVYNNLIVTGLLASINFYTVVIPPQDTADRAAVTLTLLLTIVALKLVLSSYLPPVTYLTFLDKYILICLGLCLVILIENAIIGELAQVGNFASSIQSIDRCCILAVVIVWVSLHIYLAAVIHMRLKAIRRLVGVPWSQVPFSIPSEAIIEDIDSEYAVKLPTLL